MAKGIIEITVMVLAHFLWASFAFGPMLRARTTVIHGWDLSLKRSIYIALKACLGASLLTVLLLQSLQPLNMLSDLASNLVITVIWAALWFFICSNALIKLTSTTNLISLGVARKVARSTFSYVFFGSAISIVIVGLLAFTYKVVSAW